MRIQRGKAAKKQSVLTFMGSKVLLFRNRAGLTQAELAKAVGLSRTQITNIEAGRTDVPVIRLLRIAEACGINARRLLP